MRILQKIFSTWESQALTNGKMNENLELLTKLKKSIDQGNSTRNLSYFSLDTKFH